MARHIGRRKFLATLGGAAAAWPLAAGAQQSASRVPRIGFLGSATAAGSAKAIDELRTGLREFGYVERQNIVIEFRWAEDGYDRLPQLVRELIATPVDLLITHGTPGTRAARQATSTIPIVMAISGDAVATGLVSSLAKPEPMSQAQHFFFQNSMQSGWKCSRRRVRVSRIRPRSQIPAIPSAGRSFQQCNRPPQR